MFIVVSCANRFLGVGPPPKIFSHRGYLGRLCSGKINLAEGRRSVNRVADSEISAGSLSPAVDPTAGGISNAGP